tara:strand:+ start:2007 stop:2909 length:903 start_codon:yes stop_codon:yes gene_type:complete
MAEVEGHSESAQVSNMLGQQSADLNEARLNNWRSSKVLFQIKSKGDQTKQGSDDRTAAEEDAVKVPKVYSVGEALGGAGKAAAKGAYRGISQGEGIASSLARGARGGTAVLRDSKVASTAKLFGEGSTAVKDLTGVEGIVGNTILRASTSAADGVASAGAELFAKGAAKGVAGIGLAIQGVSDVDNFMKTGSIFNTKAADGTVTKGTTAQDIGNVGTILAGGLDVLAAFTGGALAPIALAANIAVAAESTTANVEADKAQEKTDDTNVPPAKPPPAIAPPAFAQLGLAASQNHNPLDHIG